MVMIHDHCHGNHHTVVTKYLHQDLYPAYHARMLDTMC